MVIAPQYFMARDFHEGLAGVSLSTSAGLKMGFIDTQGGIAIAPQFNRVGDFADGVALVEVDGKNGFIDRMGRYLWAPSD